MKQFVSLFREIVLGVKKDTAPVAETGITFLKSAKQILQEIEYSKNCQNVLGVYSDVLGDGMFLTAVQDVYKGDHDFIIEFSKYDVSGKLLPHSTLRLSEIESVCPFNNTYHYPRVIRKEEHRLVDRLLSEIEEE